MAVPARKRPSVQPLLSAVVRSPRDFFDWGAVRSSSRHVPFPRGVITSTAPYYCTSG